jgi:hypothetical protein
VSCRCDWRTGLREIRGEERIVVAGLAPAKRAPQHARQVRARIAHAVGKRNAVHLGHVHVEHGDVERLARGDPRERFAR